MRPLTALVIAFGLAALACSGATGSGSGGSGSGGSGSGGSGAGGSVSGGTLPPPDGELSGEVRVYPIEHPQDPLRRIPPARSSCGGQGRVEADPDRQECSDEVPCRQWGCYGPGVCHGGAMPRDEIECYRHEECEGEQVCVVEPGGGCSGQIQRCQAHCRTAGCPAGSICVADGLCRPPDCRWEGHACGPNLDCQVAEQESWGYCAHRACQRTADCDCGTCVGQICVDGPGHCEQPRP